MYYMSQMQDLCHEFSYLFSWRTKEGDPIKNLYNLIGVSRTSHLDMLYKSSPVPDYIKDQLEVLELLNPIIKHKRAFDKLADKDLSLEDAVSRVLKAWCELTGYELDTKERIPMYAGQMYLSAVNQIILDIKEKDPTGLGVCLLISHYAERYMQDFNININLSGEITYLKDLAVKKAKLDAMLSYPSVKEPMELFNSKCDAALEFYKPGSKNALSFMEDDNALTPFELLVKAKNDLVAYNRFTVNTHNNTQGEMKLLNEVYYYDSVEELVSSTAFIPNSFSIAVIKDPTPEDSIFVLVVKRHDGTFIISERKGAIGRIEPSYAEKYSYDGCSYRSDRYRESLFPRHLLSRLSSDRRFESESREIIVKNDNLLGNLSEISNEQVLWLNFLFDELKDDSYFNDLPKLALFNEVEHHLLPNKSNTKNLPIGFDPKLNFEVKKQSQVSRKMIEEISPSLKGNYRLNEWMEKKFSSQVDDSTLYLPPSIKNKDDILMLNQQMLLSKSTLSNKNVDYFDDQRLKKREINLGFLTTTTLGDSEGLQRLADITARKNKAKVLRKLVSADYIENKEKLMKWVANKIAKNLPNLVESFIEEKHSDFYIFDDLIKLPDHIVPSYHVSHRQIHFAQLSFDRRYISILKTKKPTFLEASLKVRSRTQSLTKCAVTKEQDADCRFKLRVTNVFDLVKVTGVERSKLPVQLQNYGLKTKHSLDPVEMIENPWNKIDFTVVVPLSEDYILEQREEKGFGQTLPSTVNFYDSFDVFKENAKKWREESSSYRAMLDSSRSLELVPNISVESCSTSMFAHTLVNGF